MIDRTTLSIASGGALLAIPLLIPFAGTVRAQEEAPHFEVGGGAEAQFLFGSTLDGGAGPYLSVSWPPTDVGPLRIDLGVSRISLDEGLDPRSGTRAENALWTVLVGPDLVGRLWRLRAHLGVRGGLQVGAWEIEDPLAERSGSTTIAVWGGQAGLELLITRGSHPVALSTALRFLDGGELSFGRTHSSDSAGPGSVHEEEIASLGVRVGVRVGL